MRPSMPLVFMGFAQVLAERSVCMRRVKVGCIITDWDMTNVVGMGYNGPARGLAHDCSVPDDRAFTEPVYRPHPGSCTCVHAEVNALLKAPYDRGQLRMFTTLSPCPTCARLLLNSSVKFVCYLTAYRLPEGLDILTQGGVDHVKLP